MPQNDKVVTAGFCAWNLRRLVQQRETEDSFVTVIKQKRQRIQQSQPQKSVCGSLLVSSRRGIQPNVAFLMH